MTTNKGAWRKCEGCRKAKVACTLAGKKVKKPSIRKSPFSSSDYEYKTVLVEGIDCEYISLPDMKKNYRKQKESERSKNQKNLGRGRHEGKEGKGDGKGGMD